VWNGADDRVRVVDGDLRDAAVLPADARFDLVTGTPPYFLEDEGVVSEVLQRKACRFETRGGVEAYLEAASRWLAPAGTFVLCCAAPQRQRVLDAARAHGLFVRSWLDVVPKAGKAPLVGVAVVKRSAGDLAQSALLVRTAEGQWTPEFRALRAEMGMPDRPPRKSGHPSTRSE
jgi:tRNA1Val (adenine37-N6)-methyltransferase